MSQKADLVAAADAAGNAPAPAAPGRAPSAPVVAANAPAPDAAGVNAPAPAAPAPDAGAVALMETLELYGNIEVAPGIGMLVLRAPLIATRVQPGQFIHLRLEGLGDRLLRRPFSVLDADAVEGIIWILYQAVGEGTRWLYTRVQEAIDEETVKPIDPLSLGRLDAVGPLGRGWHIPPNAKHVLLVGGGIGLAPLQMLAADCARRNLRVEAVVGAQRAELLLCTKPFIESVTEKNLHIVTDDGSAGHKGFTTDVVRELLRQESFDYVATCGPEPMQRLVAELAAAAGVACEVSLERRMACGVGACLSCVVQTTEGSRRACVDGPVFNAREVIW